MRPLVTICACMMVGLAGLAAERNIANLRTISVSGTAITRTSPDVIVWTLQISDSDKNMLVAKRSNDERVKAILGLRKDLGLKEGDLETVGTLRSPGVLALMDAALAEAEPPLPSHGGGFAIIKSVSAKQRPRRKRQNAS